MGQHLGLEAPHLAGRCRSLRHGPATHDPTQGRIVRQSICIVDVLVPGEPPKHRLAQLSGQRVAAILACPGIGEGLSGQVRQAEGIIEVSKGEQTSIGRHSRTVERQLQAGIESDPERGFVFFTRCTVHLQPR